VHSLQDRRITGGRAAQLTAYRKLPPGLPREVTMKVVAALIVRCCVITTLVAVIRGGAHDHPHS